MIQAAFGEHQQPGHRSFRSTAALAALAFMMAACGGGSGSDAGTGSATPSPSAPPSGQPSSDTVAPTVALTSPVAGGALSGTATVTASASDDVGVVAVQFLVDGVSLGAEDTAVPYTVSWNTSLVANGAHTLAVRARDAAGNVTLSTAVPVTVSNAAPPAPPSGPLVTSFQLQTPQSGTRVPFTVGLAFGKGDVTGTPALQLAEQQVVVTRRWNDNSVKHAVASGHVDLVAGAANTVNVLRSGGMAGTALTAADIAIAAPQASVSLGAYGSVDLASLLAAPVRTFVAGPEMAEAHYRATVGGDQTFQVWFHVRHYKTGRTWIRVSVENGALDVASSSKSYTPTVSIGGATVFNNGGLVLTHHANTRWTAEGWIGGDPQITPKHDTAYLKAAQLVPNYHALQPGAVVLGQLYESYMYGQGGDWTPSMGNTGYQEQIGLLPLWDALYITSQADARAYRSVIANAKALNSYRIVWTDSATRLPLRLTDRPTWTFYGPGGGGGDPAGTGTLHWESAHHGSGGYLAYLITGDYYHLETMMHQSAMCYLGQSSTGGSGTARFISGQTRRMAWCLRTIGQLAGIAPPSPIVDDYRALLASNANTLNARRLDPQMNGLGYLYDYGANGVLAYGNGASSPWMQHFKMQAFGHVSDLEPLADMTTWNAVRNHLYKGAVGILGPAGAGNYCFTRASNYTIKFSAGESLDPTTWYDSWGEVYQGTFGAPNTSCGNTLEGGSGGSPTHMSGYWGNLMPAIAYAVDDGAPGAGDAWGRLTVATNWSTLINSAADLPTWAVVPRTP